MNPAARACSRAGPREERVSPSRGPPNIAIHKIVAKPRGCSFNRGVTCELSPGKNIVYFDLETQKSADEVGGWNNIRDMRMSVGVTYSTRRGEYRIYGERQVDELINELMRADLVVGFNVARFDYEVLHGYTVFDLRQVPTLDMLLELQKTINHRLSLDAIATSTLGVEKTSEGMQAIEWFRQGRLLEIAEYCCYDVKITKLVHEFGATHRQLFYKNRFGAKLSVPVNW